MSSVLNFRDNAIIGGNQMDFDVHSEYSLVHDQQLQGESCLIFGNENWNAGNRDQPERPRNYPFG